MKKNLLIVLALALSANIFAQEFDLTKLRAGAGLVYATEIGNIGIEDNLNLAPEIRYTIMDGSFLRIGASVQYLF